MQFNKVVSTLYFRFVISLFFVLNIRFQTMKNVLLFLLSILCFACQNSSQESTEKTTTSYPAVQKIVVDESDKDYGYYMIRPTQSDSILGAVVLLPGLSQPSENVFSETEIDEFASANQLLTIAFSAKLRLSADEKIQEKLNAVLAHVIENYGISRDKFVIGGFSNGGRVALRYTQLCKQFPEQFPIDPQAVFMGDSPIDMYRTWQQVHKENISTASSEIAVREASFVQRIYQGYYGGTPDIQAEKFKELSPFSIDTTYGRHEIWLKDTPVRTYHDVDITWRLKERNQPARMGNYIASSELINRLLLLGNEEAEFIQTFQTGYRKDGTRHPHAWSIIDAEECINWIQTVL